MIVTSSEPQKLGALIGIEDRRELGVDAIPQRIKPRVRRLPDIAQGAPMARENRPGRVLLDRREIELPGESGHHVRTADGAPEHDRIVAVPPDDDAVIDCRARQEGDEEGRQHPAA